MLPPLIRYRAVPRLPAGAVPKRGKRLPRTHGLPITDAYGNGGLERIRGARARRGAPPARGRRRRREDDLGLRAGDPSRPDRRGAARLPARRHGLPRRARQPLLPAHRTRTVLPPLDLGRGVAPAV